MHARKATHRLGASTRARAATELDDVALSQLLRSRLEIVAVHENVGVAGFSLGAEGLVGLNGAVALARIKPKASAREARRVDDDRLHNGRE